MGKKYVKYRVKRDFLDYFHKYLGGMRDFPEKDKTWITGGFIRDFFTKDRFKDIDISFKTEEAMRKVFDFLDEKKRFSLVNNSPTAVTLKGYLTDKKITIQLLKVRYGDLEHHLEDFDFTATKFGYSLLDRRYIIHHKDAITHAKEKRIVYETTKENSFPSIYRALKFEARGYHTTRNELVKMVKSADPSKPFPFYL